MEESKMERKGLDKLSWAITFFVLAIVSFVFSWAMDVNTTYEKMPSKEEVEAAFLLQQDMKVVGVVIGITCISLSFLFMSLSLFQLKCRKTEEMVYHEKREQKWKSYMQ